MNVATRKRKDREPSAPVLSALPSPPLAGARQRIVAEARRHFLAHGFRGVTMDDVATEIAMSKKTLYAHFRSKTALLEAVLNDKLADVNADLECITKTASSEFLVTLRLMLACLQEHAAEIQPAFPRDIRREAPELFALVQTRRRKIIQEHFGQLFAEGRRAGIIRKDLPTPVLVEMLLCLADAIVNPQKLGELGMTVSTGFTAVIAIFLEGAISRTGPTPTIKGSL